MNPDPGLFYENLISEPVIEIEVADIENIIGAARSGIRALNRMRQRAAGGSMKLAPFLLGKMNWHKEEAPAGQAN